MEYRKFLETKKHLLGSFGFDPNYIPNMAFDFQREIITRACKKGRMAVFADTGLGKTLIQLSLAQNVVNHTQGKVLILTPLAVAFQFIIEAEKMGITDIEYSKDGTHTKSIVICNYERLHYFNSEDFKGVVLILFLVYGLLHFGLKIIVLKSFLIQYQQKQPYALFYKP